VVISLGTPPLKNGLISGVFIGRNKLDGKHIARMHETGIKSYPEQSTEGQGRGIFQGEWFVIRG